MKDSKKCKVCEIEKSLNEFSINKNGYLGKSSSCKECTNNKAKENRLKNYKDIVEYRKEYYKNNKNLIKIRSDKYYQKHKNKYREYGLKYYVENKEKLNQFSKEYYKNNSIKLNNYGKEWRKNNIEKCREYTRERNHKNLELASIKWMRNFLYRTEQLGFKKTKANTITEFGYSPKQLIQRIECQFKVGMSWNNRKEWHIDHKKPMSLFKEGTSPRIINMLSNLQPVWKLENLSKTNKFKSY